MSTMRLTFLGLGLFMACVSAANGQESKEAPSTKALVASWAAFDAKFARRIKNVNSSRPVGQQKWADVEVIHSDLLRSNSLIHPIVGVIELQLYFAEDLKPYVRLRTVGYQLRFVPDGGQWKFADGVASMIWSMDESNDHIGERARFDPDRRAAARFGMDVISLLLKSED